MAQIDPLRQAQHALGAALACLRAGPAASIQRILLMQASHLPSMHDSYICTDCQHTERQQMCVTYMSNHSQSWQLLKLHNFMLQQ